MQMRKSWLPPAALALCLTLPVLLALPAYGEGSEETLSFPRVMDIAVRYNTDLKEAEAKLQDALADLEGAKKAIVYASLTTTPVMDGAGSDTAWSAGTTATAGVLLPTGGTVSYVLNWIPGNKVSSVPGYGTISLGEGFSNPVAGQLQVSQPLFRDPDVTGLRYQLTKAQLKIDQLAQARKQAEDKLRLDVLNAYIGVLKAQEALDTAQHVRTRAERQLRIVKKQVEVGVALPITLQDAEIALLQADVAVDQAEGAREAACRVLAHLAGGWLPNVFRVVRPELAPVKETGDLLKWPAEVVEEGKKPAIPTADILQGLQVPSLEVWNSTLTSHPSVLSAEIGLKLGRLELKAAVAEEYPQVSLIGSYGQSYNSILGTAGDENAWSLGVKVTLDANLAGLGNLTQQTAVRAAEAGVRGAEKARNDAMRGLEMALLQDYHAYEAARDKLMAARKSLDRAQKWAQIQKVKADQGLVTALEADTANDEAIKAEGDFYTAACDYQAALETLRVDSGLTNAPKK